MPFDILTCPLIVAKEGHCWKCGKALQGRRRRWCSKACGDWCWKNHDWGAASLAAVKRDGRKCVKCGSGERLEVNHIVPRNGAGYGMGCWNHLDGLETLCHDCHVRVTTAQIRARRGILQRVPPPIAPTTPMEGM